MHHHDDSPSLFTLVRFARQHRKQPTRSERIFWRAVCQRQLGVRVRRQHPMHPYIVDFYVPAYRLVIELDGGAHASEAARLADARRGARSHLRRSRAAASGRARRARARGRARRRAARGPVDRANRRQRSRSTGNIAGAFESRTIRRMHVGTPEWFDAHYLGSDDARAQSGFRGSDARWEAARRLIACAVDAPGTLLDVGCANGLLMESLARSCSRLVRCGRSLRTKRRARRRARRRVDLIRSAGGAR